MYCSECGSAQPVGAKFCSSCGTAVLQRTTSEQNPAPENTFVTRPVQPPATASISKPSYEPRPWPRFWARFTDTLIFAVLLSIIFSIFLPQAFLVPVFYLALAFLALPCWVVVESALLTRGNTLGKWLMSIQLTKADDSKKHFIELLRRNFQVVWRGWGFGIPVLWIITNIYAYQHLKHNGRTSWDRDGNFKVIHSKIGWFKISVTVTLLFLSLVISAISNKILAVRLEKLTGAPDYIVATKHSSLPPRIPSDRPGNAPHHDPNYDSLTENLSGKSIKPRFMINSLIPQGFKTKFVSNHLGQPVVETIYLGLGCQAFSNLRKKGKWSEHGGVMTVRFEKSTFTSLKYKVFPLNQHDCQHGAQ